MPDHLFDLRHSADEYIVRKAKWLRKLRILDRPWVILGSAPDPILPTDLLRTHARIDINNAGKTALAMGLGRADLTFRSHKKSWKEHDKVDTRGMVWIRDRPARLPHIYLIAKPFRRIGYLTLLTKSDRNEIVARASGVSVSEVGNLGKVSNGVAAACYGLFLGVPEIVLSGISLSKTGHSYDGLGRHRMQVEEDAYVLKHLVGQRLATTDAELADRTGIRLWT